MKTFNVWMRNKFASGHDLRRCVHKIILVLRAAFPGALVHVRVPPRPREDVIVHSSGYVLEGKGDTEAKAQAIVEGIYRDFVASEPEPEVVTDQAESETEFDED